MSTPLVVYRRLLGERFSLARLGADASLDAGERGRLRDALLEHYDGYAPDCALQPGEFRPVVDIPAPLSLAAPPEMALASVIDPMALRREQMAKPLKRAILAGTRVVMADPVARLLADHDSAGLASGAAGPQLIAALGVLTQLAPLIEQGVLLLAAPSLAEMAKRQAHLSAVAHWIVDAAQIRQRPGWRSIRVTRDPAFDRFAVAAVVERQFTTLERAAGLGVPGHPAFADPAREATEAAALGDLFWALGHYDLGDIDRSMLSALDVEQLGERRRDGATDAAEPVCGAGDAPFGHIGRFVSSVWPAPGAIALDEIVSIRLGEETFEEWRQLVGDWLRDAAAASAEARDPRSSPQPDLRDRFAEWERVAAERLARLKLGRAIEAAHSAGQQLALGVALASRPDAVAQALSAAGAGASRLGSALERLILAPAAEGQAPPLPGAYLAETLRRAR